MPLNSVYNNSEENSKSWLSFCIIFVFFFFGTAGILTRVSLHTHLYMYILIHRIAKVYLNMWVFVHTCVCIVSKVAAQK